MSETREQPIPQEEQVNNQSQEQESKLTLGERTNLWLHKWHNSRFQWTMALPISVGVGSLIGGIITGSAPGPGIDALLGSLGGLGMGAFLDWSGERSRNSFGLGPKGSHESRLERKMRQNGTLPPREEEESVTNQNNGRT